MSGAHAAAVGRNHAKKIDRDFSREGGEPLRLAPVLEDSEIDTKKEPLVNNLYTPRTPRTPRRQNVRTPYFRLAVIWLLSSLCGGVTPGLTLSVPLFAENGLFADCPGDKCREQFRPIANLLGVVAALSSLGFVPVGLLFDLVGGRACGFFSAISMAVGAMFLAVSLVHSSATLTAAAVLLMDFANLVNVGAFNGLMWHLPNAQGFVFAMSFGAAQAGSVLPVVLRSVMTAFDLSLGFVLVAYAVVAFISAFFIAGAVPAHDEFLSQGQAVLCIPCLTPAESWESVESALKMGLRILNKQKRDVFLLSICFALSAAAGAQYTLQLAPFATAMFRNSTLGEDLQVFQFYAAAIVSLVGALLFGFIVDLTSLGILASCNCVLLLVVLLLGSVPSFTAQATCVVASSLIQLAQAILVTRFVAYIAPSHRFGVISGLVWVCMTLGTFAGITVWSICAALFDGVEAYTVPGHLLGLLGLLTWVLLTHRLMMKPLPAMILTGKDEQDLMWENFGLRSFADAEEVLRMDRVEMLRLLASQDVNDRRHLIDVMREPQVQVRLSGKAYDRGDDGLIYTARPVEMANSEYFALLVGDWERKISRYFCCENTKANTPRPRG